MSIRAYRVIKVEREQNPTFNLWHDEKIMDFIEEHNSYNPMNNLNDDACGQMELEVEVLKKLLKQKQFEIDDYQRKAIQADIDFAKKYNDDYVLYDCF